MKILLSNMPWFDGKDNFFGFKVDRGGVRSGSRWPLTYKILNPLSFLKKPFYFRDYRIPYAYYPAPFFLMSAASYIEKNVKGSRVVIRDSIVRRESEQAFLDFLNSEKFDLIFIETSTNSWANDERLIKKIVSLNPRTKLAICGTISESQFYETLKIKNVIAAVRGEFEKNFVKVVNGAVGFLDFDFMTKEEMNLAPHPKWDNEVANWYYDMNPRGGDHPRMHVMASRGCPYKCIFCVWPSVLTGNDQYGDQARKVRYYTPEFLEPYIIDSINKFKFKSVWFDDDTFNLGTAQTERMCNMMTRINVPWYAMCRADTVDLKVWNEMKNAGCKGIKIGVESGSQYVVDKIINKNLDLNYTKEVVKYCRSIGMTVHGTFTIGHPGETEEQMYLTLKYIKETPFSSVQISGASVFSDTPLKNLENKLLKSYSGAKIDENYSHHSDGNKKWIELSKKLRTSKPLV